MRQPLGNVPPPILPALVPTPSLPDQQPKTGDQQGIFAQRCHHGRCMRGLEPPIPLGHAIEIGESLKIAARNGNTFAAGID